MPVGVVARVEVSGSRGRSGVGVLHQHRLTLWAAALGLFVVGDTATTVVGLQSGYVVEVGPVVAPVVRGHGHTAIVGLKLATTGLCYAFYRLAPAPHSVGVPLGLATLGGLVSGWNLVVIAVAYG
jgi:hypothetical protein